MEIYIGNDILQIDRIKEKIENSDYFLKKAYTDNEIAYIKDKQNSKYNSLAGIFSAKESLIKAFSKFYPKTLGIKDFEVLHKNKIPYVNILNTDLKKYESSTDISISHDGNYASSTAIVFVRK